MSRQTTLRRTWKGRVVVACTLAVVWIVGPSSASAANGLLSVDNARPQVGQTITVTLALSHASPFATWGAFMRFDPSRLRFTAQSAGSVTNFVADSRSAAEINASGEVRMGGYTFTNVTQAGSLARVSFQALSTGTTVVATENLSVGELFGNVLLPLGGSAVLPSVPSPLTITVTDGSVPPTLRIGSVAKRGDRVVVTWPSRAGRVYDVLQTDNLAGGFTNVVATGIPATAPMNTYTSGSIRATATFGFYRIVER